MSGLIDASDIPDRHAVADIRRLVSDLFGHRPAIYWTDMLLTASVGWGSLFMAVAASTTWALIGWSVIAGVAMLRAVLFTHEIAHFRPDSVPGFTPAWNVLVGIPMLIPAFMYTSHLDHHRRGLYGTLRDPEYWPLAWTSRRRVVLFVAHAVAVPAAMVLRFGVLGPLSWLIPPFRTLVVRHVSSLVVNTRYVRGPLKGRERVTFFVTEVLAAAWVWGIGIAIATSVLPARFAWAWLLTGVTAVLLNQVRTLSAHLYENDGESISTLDQLEDSVNVRGVPFLTELMFPVGLRYHGLHHYLPDLPYHALSAAHRRLMKELPDHAVYKKVEWPSVTRVIASLWRRAGRGRAFPEAWKARSDG